MEVHQENLNRLCRICGRLQSRLHHCTHQCSEYTERLEMTFRVNVQEDLEGVHPKEFCDECYKVFILSLVNCDTILFKVTVYITAN